MWTAPEDDPRTYGNPAGELATYREYLSDYRLTIEMKCEGMDADQLARRSVPPSTLSLLGLVRHLAQMENHWFQRVLQGRVDRPRLYKREGDRDWDFTGATADDAVVQDAFATWKAEIAKADEWLDALEEADLGREVPTDDGTVATARRAGPRDRGVCAARRPRRPSTRVHRRSHWPVTDGASSYDGSGSGAPA